MGLEIAESIVRGVRLRHDVDGRLSAAAEFPIHLADDAAALDVLVAMRAELGEPEEPTRIATFPRNTMLQRVDITGRSGPELNELRSKLDRLHGINSTVVVDDGPRRWMLLIRWDAHATRRLEDLAERAGFVDVTVEPTPMALARVCGPDATYVRRFVSQGDSHHAVVRNRLPVVAIGVSTSGRQHPDIDISTVDVAFAHYDDFLTDAALGELTDRINQRVESSEQSPIPLDLVGEPYPDFPTYDHRSAQRQGVAIGAAIGAAGLAGPLRPVDLITAGATPDDQFDRPWAIESLSTLPTAPDEPTTSGTRRLIRHLRPRNRR